MTTTGKKFKNIKGRITKRAVLDRMKAKYSNINNRTIREFSKEAGTKNKTGIIEEIGNNVVGMSRRGFLVSLRKNRNKYRLSKKERDDLAQILFDKDEEVVGMTKTKKDRRELFARAAKRKHDNIRSSRETAQRIQNKRSNRLGSIYDEENNPNSIGAKLHSDDGDHEVTALGRGQGATKITRGGNASIVGGNCAKPLINDQKPLASGNSGFKQGPNLIPRSR